MASVLFRNLAHRVDRLLMPRLLSVSALGAYNRPQEFVGQVSDKISGIFDVALFPVLSGIQDNPKALSSSFRRSLYVMNMFALLLSLAFMFNSDLLIRIFFGEQWLHLRPVMCVISFSILINFDGRLADCYLRSLALTKQQFFFRVFETILGIIGVLIGYKWDILGVAIAMIGTNTIAKFIKIIYVGSKVDVKPMQVISLLFSSWRYVVLLLPICIVAYTLLPSSWGGGVTMAAIFVVTTAAIFLLTPGLLGKVYKEEVYDKIISFVKQKIHKHD